MIDWVRGFLFRRLGRGFGCRFRLRWRGDLDAIGFERRFELSGYRRLDARGRSLDELAHFLKLREGDLAVDTEFGGDFVYAWFGSHFSPV
jgi:hypothetical protein